MAGGTYRRLRERLTVRRIAQGLTQRDVAERMGAAQSQLWALETGKTDPRISTVERWAAALGAQVIYDLQDQTEVDR
jgi:transcriptional regulator with XRE-family HTH domain